MIEIEIPEQNIVVRKDGIHYAYYPYTSYLYLFNVVCIYKAQVITRDKLRELTKMSVYTKELVDTTDDIKTIVLSMIDDELVK